MDHVYSQDNISDLKEAVRMLRAVQMDIENDEAAYSRIDFLMSEIEEIIDNAEEAL